MIVSNQDKRIRNRNCLSVYALCCNLYVGRWGCLCLLGYYSIISLPVLQYLGSRSIGVFQFGGEAVAFQILLVGFLVLRLLVQFRWPLDLTSRSRLFFTVAD